MSKENGRGVNSRGTYDPDLEKLQDFLDKHTEGMTAEELESLADQISMGYELYIMDYLREIAAKRRGEAHV